MAKSPFDLSDIDVKHLKRLVDLMDDTSLTEIEMERDDIKIRLRKESQTTTVIPQIVNVPATTQENFTKTEPSGHKVKSPLIGTFYHSSSPKNPPFIEIGTKVKKGQPIGIIEAMKTINQVEADKAGTIKNILVENASPVEFGQPLVIIE